MAISGLQNKWDARVQSHLQPQVAKLQILASAMPAYSSPMPEADLQTLASVSVDLGKALPREDLVNLASLATSHGLNTLAVQASVVEIMVTSAGPSATLGAIFLHTTERKVKRITQDFADSLMVLRVQVNRLSIMSW